MRAQGLVAILSILVSMALLMIILSQQQLLTNLYREIEKLPIELERLGNEQSNLDTSKVTLEKLLTQEKNVVEHLEAEVAKTSRDMEKTKTEIDVCQAGKKTAADELAAKEKELPETDASLKAESDAWKQEITKLKAQTIGYRPICDYVKTEEKAKTSCGTKA
ncbi:fibrinogen- and Ig-binding protein-like [Cebidichthys violaceus]|uniref:fibrinogen- and Ig-binding protein-like n=1 Tax=Cebidichthys violaceus TaxID=271503 RepID=UPI0035C96827